ncbi:hypothetical protein DL764_001898 [Monosporascus ibericus]|uniref:Uncharacterized protein n=1 Tax=Monosporascus ibericus TaxID=155417 RepID=A0A4Q4TPE7_9PEZI|nr:hypothetical protein DL764_001898 [Monosporascus ibericus]
MATSALTSRDIAIIGSGCRFPGGATSPSKLWDLLCNPSQLAEPIPLDRFNVQGFYHESGQYHGHFNVKEGYFLAGEGVHRRFDASFFGMNPAEAVCLDPQCRLLLETVHEALEDAGLTIEGLKGSDTAVYAGQMVADFDQVLMRDSDHSLGTYHASGTSNAILSNRVSYFFDWHGPSMTIDTACSSSLVALHHAVQQLRTGLSRVAIAAGANLIMDPKCFISLSSLNMLSPDGRCRMWDANAKGYARGEGIAAVVLKTLSAALQDGDDIECIIRETGFAQDGKTQGITSPNHVAQTQLIRDCYSRAGLDLDNPNHRPQFFECHGTGTLAGDAAEAEAISSAFFPAAAESHRDSGEESKRILVGSIKSVIGHTEGTAGIAGILKTSLALKNAIVPPNLLFDRLNPRIRPFYANLKVPTTASSWPSVRDNPRRASVNSFGFGGANVHVILESYAPPDLAYPRRTSRPVAILQVDLIQAAGIELTAVVGHSSGEIAASYAAGFLTAEEAICIAHYRGQHARFASGPNGEHGAMMAVGTSVEDALELLNQPEFKNRACIAAANSPMSITISGDQSAIDELKIIFDDEKKFARLLKIDKAYHSHHMMACSAAYLKSLAALNIPVGPGGRSTWISSVYGGDDMLSRRELLGGTYWSDNMASPVLFKQAIARAHESMGSFDLALEIGPHPALQGPVLQTIQDASDYELPYMGLFRRGSSAVESVAECLGYVWSRLGKEAVDLQSYDTFVSGDSQYQLIKGLPAYAWDHGEHWNESRTPDSTEQDMRWRHVLQPSEIPWLLGHRLQDQIVFPAAGYVATAIEAAIAACKDRCVSPSLIELADFEFGRALVFDVDDSSIEVIVSMADVLYLADSAIEANFRYHASDGKGDGSLSLFSTARIRISIGVPFADALPAKSAKPPNLINVRADDFYSASRDLGYQWAGPFVALDNLERKLGTSTGFLNIAESSALLIHPALLDAALQGILLAHSYPDDGYFWTLHVPGKIKRVSVNPFLCASQIAKGDPLPFVSSHDPNTDKMVGNSDVYPSDPGVANAMIQIEEMEGIPLSRATVQDDKEAFANLVWDVADPSLHIVAANAEPLTQEQQSLAHHLERMAAYYMRVGAGTGALTKMILDGIGTTFSSYTFTNFSSSLFESTKALLASHLHKLIFRTLDLREDPISQGFLEKSYDLVVASFVLHSTPSLKQTLENVRRILKPGGYLIVLELQPTTSSVYGLTFGALSQLWHDVDEGRSLSPAISLVEWDHMLRQTGFSGCDAATPEHLEQNCITHFALFVAQAMDEKIAFLRCPLSPAPLELFKPGTLIEDLIILGGNGVLLWISQGRRADNPYANMMLGLMRSIIREVPTLNYRMLDFENAHDINVYALAEALVRFQAEVQWLNQDSIHISVENELVLDRRGQLMIPRLMMSKDMNIRYNSLRRPIVVPMQRHDQNVGVVPIGPFSNYMLRQERMPDTKSGSALTHIEVTHSLLSAIRIAEFDYMFVILGKDIARGDHRLALSHTHSSVATCSEELSVSVEPLTGHEARFFTLVVLHLLVSILLRGLSAGDVVLVYEPVPSLASVLVNEGRQIGAKILFITTGTEDKVEPTNLEWIRIHSSAPTRLLSSVLPTRVSAFVDFTVPTQSQPIVQRILSLLPPYCRRESLRSLFATEARLPLSSRTDEMKTLLHEAVVRASCPLDGIDLNESDALPLVPSESLPDTNDTLVSYSLVDWTRSSSVPVQIQPVDNQITFSGQKTYWLCGLSRGLGLALWAAVKIASCDVTVRDHVISLHNEICGSMPPIGGVCQGSMVLEDTAIRAMTLDNLMNGTRPKVEGSLHLNQLFQENTLDFFVFFSSVVSAIGRPGQANYSAANTFMSSLAEQRRQKGLAASVIHIGPIYGVGYAAQQDTMIYSRAAFRSTALVPTSERDFYQLFSEAIVAGRPGATENSIEVLSGLRRVSPHDNDRPVWELDPLMSHFIRNADEVSPVMLSFSQEMFWFIWVFLEDKTSLNHTAWARITGNLDIPTFQRAVRSLGQQHETLRTCIIEQDDGMSFQNMLKGVQQLYTFPTRAWAYETHQFSVYSEKQHSDIAGGKLAADLQFWKNEFVTVPPPLPILTLSKATSRPALNVYENCFVNYRQGMLKETRWDLDKGNVALHAIEIGMPKMGYDITLEMVDYTDGECVQRIMMRKDLYGQAEAQRMAQSYERLIRAPAAILYTSGSSGAPKGILVKHEGLRNWTESAAQVYSIGKEIVLQQTTPAFDLSLVQIFTALCHGGSLCLVPRRQRGDAKTISRIVASQRVTFTCATPSEYASWFHYGNPELYESGSWRTAFCIGEPVPVSLVEQIRSSGATELALYNLYGPTEASLACTGMQVPLEASCGPIAAGRPLPNYSVYVVDEQLRLMPPGVQGEIYIGGAGVGLGYLNNQELTTTKFVPDVFASSEDEASGWKTLHRTGDLGRWREDGSLLIEGRIDTQVKLRGLRIDLSEIEQAIIDAAQGSVREAVVSVRRLSPSEPECLVTHAVFNNAADISDAKVIYTRLTEKLPWYMCPVTILSLERVPTTSSGKLDRRAVAALPLPPEISSLEGIMKESPRIALTDTEARLRKIWEQILSSRFNISAWTDFFHVGGTSLILLELQASIRTVFNIDMPLIRMFESSTLRAMAHWIDQGARHDVSTQPVDWEEETSLPGVLSSFNMTATPASNGARPQVVVLTGATGQLGRALLRDLIARPDVNHVHCVGVRDVKSRHEMMALDKNKVTLHEGDLVLPRLGMAEGEAAAVFAVADAIIHNGADMSYLKTYATLRAVNLQSTKELVAMSVRYSAGRRLPFHYMSTVSVGNVVAAALLKSIDAPEGVRGAGAEQFIFGPKSVAAYPPPSVVLPSDVAKTAHGYVATKWASEVFLERLHEYYPDWSIVIHRPSLIARGQAWGRVDTSAAPGLEFVENIRRYASLLRAVPAIPAVRDKSISVSGAFDVVPLEEVSRGVISAMMEEKAAKEGVRFLHHIGGLELPLDNLRSWVTENEQDIQEIDATEWMQKAAELGMHPTMVALLNDLAAAEGRLAFPRLEK